jgi:alanyl-tRNA synthetase
MHTFLQIYDTGIIEGSFGTFNVNNVQVFAGYVLHIGSFTESSKALSVGDSVICKVCFNDSLKLTSSSVVIHF